MAKLWRLLALATAVLLTLLLFAIVIEMRRPDRTAGQMPYVFGAVKALTEMEVLLTIEHDGDKDELTMAEIQSSVHQAVSDLSAVEIYIDPKWATIVTSADDYRNVVLALRYESEEQNNVVTLNGDSRYSMEATIPDGFILVYESEQQARMPGEQ